MAADFSHIGAAYAPTSTAVAFELYELEGAPKLYVKPAAEINKPYFNAILRRARTSQGRRQITASNVHALRNEDRILYAQHILETRWEGIVDREGKPVDPTAENLLGFLKALPDPIFDRLRAFAGDLSNFLPEAVASADELGKGLPPA